MAPCITLHYARGTLHYAELTDSLEKIRHKFSSPEEINDSELTAPSKRIFALFPEFEKPIHGTFGAMEIGLEKIRQECPLFSQWLTKIESLGMETPL